MIEAIDLNFVKRERWNAMPPLHFEKTQLPAIQIVRQNTFSQPCAEPDECRTHFRRLQEFQVFYQRQADIKYNFIIGTSGAIYEGRGWFHAPFLPTLYSKERLFSLLIGYTGDATGPLPDVMAEAENNLLAVGMRHRFVDPAYKLLDLRIPYVEKKYLKARHVNFFERYVRVRNYPLVVFRPKNRNIYREEIPKVHAIHQRYKRRRWHY